MRKVWPLLTALLLGGVNIGMVYMFCWWEWDGATATMAFIAALLFGVDLAYQKEEMASMADSMRQQLSIQGAQRKLQREQGRLQEKLLDLEHTREFNNYVDQKIALMEKRLDWELGDGWRQGFNTSWSNWEVPVLPDLEMIREECLEWFEEYIPGVAIFENCFWGIMAYQSNKAEPAKFHNTLSMANQKQMAVSHLCETVGSKFLFLHCALRLEGDDRLKYYTEYSLYGWMVSQMIEEGSKALPLARKLTEKFPDRFK